MESLDDPEGGSCHPIMDGVWIVHERMEALREPLSVEETEVATDMIRGARTVEVPGRFDPENQDPAPEPMTLPEPRLMSGYITAPCRHECSIIKQVSHAKQAHGIITALNPVKQSLLRATAGQCGMDTAYCNMDTVREVTRLDRPGGGGGATERTRGKQPSFVQQRFIVSDCRLTSPD